MKNLILFLLISFTTLQSYTQKRDSVLVTSDLFTIMYSEKYEQPLWIIYDVKCSNGTASRSGMDFYTNDSIYTSDNLDYVDNIYDKGHLAPAADFNCDRETLFKTFTYLNCALQNQYLNRGVWRLLEVRERELSKTHKVHVYIRIDFSNQTLPTGARIPSGFYKEIKTKTTCEKYYFKNDKPLNNDIKQYRIK